MSHYTVLVAIDPTDPKRRDLDDFDRQAGLNLAECMLACAAQGTKLEFC